MRPLAELDEDALIGQMAREVAALSVDGAEMVLAIAPAKLLEIAGLVQLARRHPDLSPASAATGANFLEGVRAGFANAPAVLEMLARGDEGPP